MKITVHIGSTKTGSSALQMHLFQAREKLQEAGVFYPNIGTKSNAHHVLFASVHPGAWGMHRDELSDKEGERLEYFRRTFDQIIEKAQSLQVDHVVLSSEYWWGVLSDKFQKVIGQQFQQYDVRLVACLRRQDRWLEASYLQAVKSGENRKFKEWLEVKLSTPTMGGAHYLKILNHWNETLLPAETIIKPYEFSDRTEYIRHVAELICDDKVSDLVVPDQAKVINKSPNSEGVEAILKLNNSSDESEIVRFEQVSRILNELSRPENTKESTVLSEVESRQLLVKFSSINKVTHRIYGVGRSRSLFESKLKEMKSDFKVEAM